MNYKAEELLLIVAELTERYTSKESTSISYEQARQLMEAVLYCIHHCGGNGQLVSRNGIRAKEAYQLGYENLIQQVKETQTVYNEMIIDFNAYGNENYNDTVTKAIPGFFRYYDVRFTPQDTIITMDYPTLCKVTECSVILRHILGHMLIGKSLEKISDEADYNRMYEIVLEHTVEWLNKTFLELLEKLVQEKYYSDKEMKAYLQGDINNFATELFVATQNRSIKKVVVL